MSLRGAVVGVKTRNFATHPHPPTACFRISTPTFELCILSTFYTNRKCQINTTHFSKLSKFLNIWMSNAVATFTMNFPALAHKVPRHTSWRNLINVLDTTIFYWVLSILPILSNADRVYVCSSGRFSKRSDFQRRVELNFTRDLCTFISFPLWLNGCRDKFRSRSTRCTRISNGFRFRRFIEKYLKAFLTWLFLWERLCIMTIKGDIINLSKDSNY